MSAKIRLSRVGTKGKPYYRLVVQDKRVKRDGQTIEILGSLEQINRERLDFWLKKGAQISEAAKKMVGKIPK